MHKPLLAIPYKTNLHVIPSLPHSVDLLIFLYIHIFSFSHSHFRSRSLYANARHLQHLMYTLRCKPVKCNFQQQVVLWRSSGKVKAEQLVWRRAGQRVHFVFVSWCLFSLAIFLSLFTKVCFFYLCFLILRSNLCLLRCALCNSWRSLKKDFLYRCLSISLSLTLYVALSLSLSLSPSPFLSLCLSP